MSLLLKIWHALWWKRNCEFCGGKGYFNPLPEFGVRYSAPCQVCNKKGKL